MDFGDKRESYFSGFLESTSGGITIKSNIKVYLAVIILSCLICCTGLSKEIYIGPYNAIFNDTSHPVDMQSQETRYMITADAHYLPVYIGFSFLNNSTTVIRILEGNLDGNEIRDFASLEPDNGSIEIERFERVIDSLDANVAEFKNRNTGQIIQKASFAFKAPTESYSYDNDNVAVVTIDAINYTKFEFDRLLDTFKINRLIKK
jgi:hypothetical protein